jgi:RNA polymerase sigma-70 factor (ECF subfamily)
VTPHSDADVAAARSGDQRAFGHLIEARWNRLVRLARSIAGDVDAEDVAQEACLACWRKLSQLADPARFDSWLMRSVFRCAVRRARWQRLRAALVRSAPLFATSDAGRRTPDVAASDILVWQVLSRLPPRQRAVVHLTVIEGMTDSEIAHALGIRAGSVRAHRRRARQVIESWWHRQDDFRLQAPGPRRDAAQDRSPRLRAEAPTVPEVRSREPEAIPRGAP